MERDHPRTSSSSSGEHKTTKRKGTRSVSSLTPSQLERKRANDREAQRAIRARTKDRIDQLESEVKRLRSITDRDIEWQRMLRRLQLLEEENKALKSGLHISPSEAYNPFDDGHSSLHSSPVDNRSHTYSHSIRAASDPYPSYTNMPTPAPEAWESTIPVTVPTSVSSPASCAAEDYGRFPVSVLNPAVSAPMIDSIAAPTSVPYHGGNNNPVDFDSGVESSDHNYQTRPTSRHHTPTSQQYPIHSQSMQQQSWPQTYSSIYVDSGYPTLP
ncbi:hypothetical protein BD289DRAFT_479801 [Coniella lustricola]|uniref:BZIP domain-containing protein n=1 Tax=Coniella lustricola TaxID=2025994 RepID=A0A2T3AHZ0_9PEZI|nr:hypothetical protein BD289DRAFT_479801 [Coniella lustricola]